MRKHDTLLWTVHKARGYFVECVVRFVRNGVEMEISEDAALLISGCSRPALKRSRGLRKNARHGGEGK